LSFVNLEVLRKAYGEALREGYLWHEFGDVCLIAPHLDTCGAAA
jgi:S-adenosylmethionine:tRNA-ribosyltransferase-isomerase (queuine synthetase)